MEYLSINFKKHVHLILIAIFALTACKKNTTAPPVPPSTGVNVYVAGEITTSKGGNATYWKNGEAVNLSTSAGSDATGIAVEGSNIYVSGDVYAVNGYSVAVYWKNGVTVLLADSLSFSVATSITVQGSDVYVTGYINNSVPVYWKNGAAVMLPLNGSTGGFASAIAVNGLDVYVAGNTVADNNTAIYWKNGIPFTLAGGATANAIAVQGNDVYVTGCVFGFLNNTATLWKNGVPVNLTTTGILGSALQGTGVAIQGNDVYMAGEAGYSAGASNNSPELYMIYWKNGIVANPTGAPQVSSNPATYTGPMAVNGNDVYVAGTFGGSPGYWKNDTLIYLTNNDGNARAIAVVPINFAEI